MNRIYGQYRDRATFYVVYIEEAHPIDLWELDSNVEDHVIFKSARTEAERSDTAALCVVRLSIKIPALLDDIDNRTERAYTGWPDRLYLVGTDGRIRYKSAAGPFGFSPRDLEAALVETLGGSRQAERRPIGDQPTASQSPVEMTRTVVADGARRAPR